jgi:hypothetical protein
MIDSDPSRGGKFYGLFMRWTRRIHMYLGLFLLPWVLLYGTSALFFNHADFLADHVVRELRIPGNDGSALATLPALSVYAERILQALRERDGKRETDYQLAAPEEARFVGRVHVTVEAHDARHELFLDAEDGEGLLRTYPTGRSPEEPLPLRQISSLELEDPLQPWIEANALDLLQAEGLWAERAIHRNGPHVEFQLRADGELWKVNYDVGTSEFRANPVDRRLGSISPRNFLTKMHTSHGFPSEARPQWFWAFAMDVMGCAMILWAFSGIPMWWQMPKVRMWGGLTIILSLLAACGLGYAMYMVFTN